MINYTSNTDKPLIEGQTLEPTKVQAYVRLVPVRPSIRANVVGSEPGLEQVLHLYELLL